MCLTIGLCIPPKRQRASCVYTQHTYMCVYIYGNIFLDTSKSICVKNYITDLRADTTEIPDSLSLAIRPYCPSFLANLLYRIQYLHRADTVELGSPVIWKILNTKRYSKKFPSHLLKAKIESVKFMYPFKLSYAKLRMISATCQNSVCLLHLHCHQAHCTPTLGHIHPTRKVKRHYS